VTLVETAFAGDEPFSFDGPFHQYEDVQLSVLPLQRPHPPLWVQSRDQDTPELLARVGAVPRYREYLRRWQAAGHAHKPNISYWTLVYVGETDEAAVAQAAPHIVHAFSRVFGSIGTGTPQSLANNFRRRAASTARPRSPSGSRTSTTCSRATWCSSARPRPWPGASARRPAMAGSTH
jgi:alkanesulfonate monooxygenase SsuD/methylene tetrahydromethanopterin reductase-like flavin-dependent oxidoreductase (luciferase family)